MKRHVMGGNLHGDDRHDKNGVFEKLWTLFEVTKEYNSDVLPGRYDRFDYGCGDLRNTPLQRVKRQAKRRPNADSSERSQLQPHSLSTIILATTTSTSSTNDQLGNCLRV
jgi:hypothetical protein